LPDVSPLLFFTNFATMGNQPDKRKFDRGDTVWVTLSMSFDEFDAEFSEIDYRGMRVEKIRGRRLCRFRGFVSDVRDGGNGRHPYYVVSGKVHYVFGSNSGVCVNFNDPAAKMKAGARFILTEKV